MDKAALVSRYLLGVIYVFFGINYFAGFVTPPPPTAEGGAFLGALAATGYMFPFIKVTEIVAGLALLSNKFSALAMVVIAPVSLNIFLYHAILDPSAQGLFVPVLIIVASLVYVKSILPKYSALLSAN